MDGGAWWAAVHGVARSRTRLSDFTFTFHFHALEKEMATHSSVLAWRIPGTGEPGGLPSLGLQSRTRLKQLSSSSSSSCVTLGKTLRLSELYCPPYLSGLFWKFIKSPITQITHLAFNACMVFFLPLSTIWLIIKHLEPIKILKVQCWNELIFLGFKCRISLVFKQ